MQEWETAAHEIIQCNSGFFGKKLFILSSQDLIELDHGGQVPICALAVNEIFLYKSKRPQANLYHKMFIIRPHFVEFLMRFIIQLNNHFHKLTKNIKGRNVFTSAKACWCDCLTLF